MRISDWSSDVCSSDLTGVRYVLHSWKTRGVSKAEALEMLAMSFIHAGPRGMQAIAEAARGIEFEEKPANPGNYPDRDAERRILFETTGAEDRKSTRLNSSH